MWKTPTTVLLLLLFTSPGRGSDDAVPPSLLGDVSRAEIEAAEPHWVTTEIEAEIDSAAALALMAVPSGAQVEVYLGTWCSDSERELARFFRALDESGSMVPFEIRYIAVDRKEKRPLELLHDLDLQYVPTFIVRRNGNEIGRVVESTPLGIGIEGAVLSLLDGSVTGVITGRIEN